MDIPKIVVRNKKSAKDKELEKIAKICDLMGKRTALIELQTDIWEKTPNPNKLINKSYQIFKKNIIPILYNLSKNKNKKNIS